MQKANYNYQLALTAPGGEKTVDITELVSSLTWSGSARQTAREISGGVLMTEVTAQLLAEGAHLTLITGGEQRFIGPLLSVTTTSRSSTADISALDRGRFLVGNEGWYSFADVTPEAACAVIAADFGLPAADFAETGVKVSRKFAGVALDRIMTSLYALAGEQNGKRYHIGFDGEGRLRAAERPKAATLEIASTMGVTSTWDISELQNSVAIYTDDGAAVRRVQDAASIAKNGRLEHVIKQKRGDDASKEAEAWLGDKGLAQKLTVETLGDERLVSGAAVALRDTGSGVSGLFWIDSDVHTWKNRQYFTKLTLSFKELLPGSAAGSEV